MPLVKILESNFAFMMLMLRKRRVKIANGTKKMTTVIRPEAYKICARFHAIPVLGFHQI